MAKNKVKFNLSNVHFAPLVEADDGTISWDTPIPITCLWRTATHR